MDIETSKIVRREFSRRQIDVSKIEIHVCRGIVTVRGNLDIHSAHVSTTDCLKALQRNLKNKTNIRDVIFDLAG